MSVEAGDPVDLHACPRCGALGPCDPAHCPTYHECGECGKSWVRYAFAQQGYDPLGGPR